MMSRAARYARYNHDDKLEVSLFPFLSIFLCVMGVLSFINVLSSYSAPKKIELTAQLAAGYKVAYQVFSLPDGIITLPPTENLQQLQDAVRNNSDKKVIERIAHYRKKVVDKLKNHKGSIMNAAIEPDVEEILDTLHNIRALNEIALRANYLYEEFILFGIYPNGGQAYQKIRDVMASTTDSKSIAIGLEPLDSNWTLSLGGSGSGNKQTQGNPSQ